MSVIRQTNSYRAFNFSYFLSSNCVALLFVLTPFVLTGGVLTAEKLFLTLNLYRVSRDGIQQFLSIMFKK
jgi:hypothetical protein